MDSKKFLVSIDLKGNQILNGVIEQREGPPDNPKEGQVYYNKIEKKVYCFDGNSWKELTNSPYDAGAALS